MLRKGFDVHDVETTYRMLPVGSDAGVNLERDFA